MFYRKQPCHNITRKSLEQYILMKDNWRCFQHQRLHQHIYISPSLHIVQSESKIQVQFVIFCSVSMLSVLIWLKILGFRFLCAHRSVFDMETVLHDWRWGFLVSVWIIMWEKYSLYSFFNSTGNKQDTANKRDPCKLI